MNKKFGYIVVVSMVLLSTGLVYHQTVNAQQKGDTVDQGDVRQFLELGEEKYREECFMGNISPFLSTDNDVLLDYMPDEQELREGLCEKKISEIKNQTLGSILKEDEK